MFYNYHEQAKKKIKQNKLIKFEIVDDWNGIKPALVLYFSEGKPMPIRFEHFQEYFQLMDKINKNK